MVNGKNRTRDKNYEINNSNKRNTELVEKEIEKPEVLNEHQLQPNKKQNVTIRRITSIHEGPLPDPETFEKYDKVCPGAADRILTMAEEQMHHRHKLEYKFLDSRVKNSTLGILVAFVTGIAIIVSGVICILNNHSVAGTVFSGVGKVTIIATFLQNTKMTEEDNIDKKEEKKE